MTSFRSLTDSVIRGVTVFVKGERSDELLDTRATGHILLFALVRFHSPAIPLAISVLAQ
jgi:hypothetical protein